MPRRRRREGVIEEDPYCEGCGRQGFVKWDCPHCSVIYCKKESHGVSNCPELRNYLCQRCGGLGHAAQYCRLPPLSPSGQNTHDGTNQQNRPTIHIASTSSNGGKGGKTGDAAPSFKEKAEDTRTTESLLDFETAEEKEAKKNVS